MILLFWGHLSYTYELYSDRLATIVALSSRLVTSSFQELLGQSVPNWYVALVREIELS